MQEPFSKKHPPPSSTARPLQQQQQGNAAILEQPFTPNSRISSTSQVPPLGSGRLGAAAPVAPAPVEIKHRGKPSRQQQQHHQVLQQHQVAREDVMEAPDVKQQHVQQQQHLQQQQPEVIMHRGHQADFGQVRQYSIL